MRVKTKAFSFSFRVNPNRLALSMFRPWPILVPFDRRTNSITRRLRADYVARVHFRGGTRFNRDYDFSRALINSTVVPDRAGEGKRRVEGIRVEHAIITRNL